MTKANQHDADHEPPLHQISVGDLNSRGAWERLITTLREVHVANPSCALNIFGEGQNQYLVVNIYDSDTSSTEFFFSAHDELQRLDVLMEALETIGYSLARLIERLASPAKTDSEGRRYLDLGRLKIVKSTLASN